MTERLGKRFKAVVGWAPVLACCAGLSLGWGVQAGPLGAHQERSIFRRLTRGEAFPAFAIVQSDGQAGSFEVKAGRPQLIAFLRHDQQDSLKLFATLETLALEADGPKSPIWVVAMRGAQGWQQRTKALPARMGLVEAAPGIGEKLGLIVLPSVAVLDAEGRLQRAHVLYDETLIDTLRKELELLASGDGAALDAQDQRRLSFEALKRNASLLERRGDLLAALPLRRQLLETGLEEAQARHDLGRVLLKLGQAQAALEHFRASLELEDSLSGQVWLGRALADSGAGSKAKRVLLKVLPQTPQKAVVHRALAKIYKDAGDLDQALSHIKAAIAARRSKL